MTSYRFAKLCIVSSPLKPAKATCALKHELDLLLRHINFYFSFPLNVTMIDTSMLKSSSFYVVEFMGSRIASQN